MKKGHVVKVLKSRFITHDVKSFVVEKPEGYDFIPGQATKVAINRPDLKKKIWPFNWSYGNQH